MGKKKKKESKKSKDKKPTPFLMGGRGTLEERVGARDEWFPSDPEYANGVESEAVPLDFPEGTNCFLGMLDGHVAAIVDHCDGVWFCQYLDMDLAPLARVAFTERAIAREWLESQELDKILTLNSKGKAGGNRKKANSK